MPGTADHGKTTITRWCRSPSGGWQHSFSPASCVVLSSSCDTLVGEAFAEVIGFCNVYKIGKLNGMEKVVMDGRMNICVL